MSDAAGYTDRLNLADLVARIERQQEETRKFVAEQGKLNAERAKLDAEAAKMAAERIKLDAEAGKLGRDRSLAPAQLVLTAMAAGATLFGAGAAFWKVVGG